MKSDQCPRCGSSYIAREHKKQGCTECTDCGLKLPHDAWKRLRLKLANGHNAIFEVRQPDLTEEEALVVAQRREELWFRLDRFGDQITTYDEMKNVKNVILQFISELESRGEIPYGLTVEEVGPNLTRYDKDRNGNDHPRKGELMFPGHIVVKFGLVKDCPKENREPLLPYLGGRKCLL